MYVLGASDVYTLNINSIFDSKSDIIDKRYDIRYFVNGLVRSSFLGNEDQKRDDSDRRF